MFINNETEYSNALARAYDLLQLPLETDSAATDELDNLCTAIEEYEKVHWPIDIRKD